MKEIENYKNDNISQDDGYKRERKIKKRQEKEE